jgi:hypothetical protein
MIDRFSNSCIPLVNESFGLMVFMFMVLMITRHKKLLEAQKERSMMDPLTGVATGERFSNWPGRTSIDHGDSTALFR